MTDLGEAISAPEFLSDEDHNEKTCPWHDEAHSGNAEPMEEPNPETDTDSPSMDANSGGKLGRNLAKAGQKKPKDKITLEYAPDEMLHYKQGSEDKKVQTYTDTKSATFNLTYAPHHLIPGNESLAESKLVKYLGDDNVIKNFNKNGYASKIKDKQSVEYNVNDAKNGVWLPSPYALSMKNKWPSSDGKKYILEVRGQKILDIAVSFQKAYVAAAVHKSGNRQFHMRHKAYSNEVKDVLNGIAVKMDDMSAFACPIACDGESDGKFDAPTGLVARLNLLSDQLKKLLIGKSWHPPFYADEKSMKEYEATLKYVVGLKPEIEHIM